MIPEMPSIVAVLSLYLFRFRPVEVAIEALLLCCYLENSQTNTVYVADTPFSNLRIIGEFPGEAPYSKLSYYVYMHVYLLQTSI